MVIPLREAYITNEYGDARNNGIFHKGLDIISRVNDRNVRAMKSGVVSFVGYDANGFGNYVSISQDDGYRVLYCHLDSYQVSVGEKIAEAQNIGIEGTTGNSTGVHLHLEIRKAPYTLNDYINAAVYLGIKNQRGVVEFIEEKEEEEIMIERLISEYGEDIVYGALKNICEKEKNKNVVPNWAEEEYSDAIEAGVTDGTRPQALATRVETAVMIERSKDAEEKINSVETNE